VSTSEWIFRRDAAGNLRVWMYEVEGNQYRTYSGVHRGACPASSWTVCVGKQGRSDGEQAQFEAEALYKQKLDREYRRTRSELDSVPTSPMLAKDYKKLRDSVSNCFASGVVVFSQPKLDGIRCKATSAGGFSRELQRHHNIDHVLEALAPLFKEFPALELDGELYNHDLRDDFNKIASVVRKQKPDAAQREIAAGVIQYHIYDLPSDGSLPFRGRTLQIGKLFAILPRDQKSLVRVATDTIHNQEELDAAYGRYLEDGYEGQMVRLNAPYDFDKRSKFLLKRKEFITDEFPVSRVIEGLGNWAGYAKAVEYILPGDKRLENGERPKAGIKGDQANAKKLLGTTWSDKSTVTIRYFTPTPLGIPRFPVAIDFHPEGRTD
jgi:DNA ligase-1